MPIRLVIACTMMCLSTNAFAQQVSGVLKEINGYRTLNVYLVGDIKDCYIDKTDFLAKHAATKLKEIGISEDPKSIVHANLTLFGQSFGMGKTQCVLTTTLNFTATLTNDNITTKNQRVREAMDRLKSIPVSLWESTTYGVAALTERANLDDTSLPPSTKGREAALKAIDSLVANANSFKQ